MIVPWAAGGGTDLISRHLASLAEDTCGTRIVVSNVTGAAGATGHQAVIDADPDGYTIGTATTELAILNHLDGASFSPKDVTGLVQLAANPAVLTVGADSPYETFDDLKEGLASGEKIRAATNGPGGTWDLAVRGLALELDTEFTEYVPFDGAAAMIPAVLGGQVEAMSPSAGEVQEQIEAGKLRGLATMAEERSEALPEVPTLKEEGVNWEMGSWIGSVAPAGIPEERVETLRTCFGEAVSSEEFSEFRAEIGMGVADRDGAEFTDFINSEYDRFEPLIDELY
ncbi:tripartite tricarboxylate transporter substrate binding protein [Marihabitans asiaticum]|uniref:Tripartite-type tricarboxylate transporter receptor subunit TctC n=1 Tax=Marihabitans asiaticum TaxID=415218 RepID=A0A560WGK7_9MICO|nr:tripartite tricarboxylate transporter substrate binding protein [Marihabitans asiaticum]TWD16817.1 tripartite-type tricarboxylate transporter receptor subunit TctC [Marihabitans asiaticum]